MEEGGGLALGEGGSHGGLGAGARQRDADDDGCLASDGGRGRGWDRGPLGLSRPRGQVGWAVVSVWAGWQAKAEKVAGQVEEGRGHEEVGPEGRARLAQMGQRGESIWVRFQVGFGPMRFRKISK
jgi:hypothetical protein